MTQQQYTPVSWQDETTSQQGTLINAERLNQMQTAHHFADGLEEVDTVPTADPGVAYHKIVYCTADNTLYRWDGEAWTADIDDPTRELLEEHEADHDNPHQVTKSQVGLGNADNTSDMDKPISTATQTALNAKADKSDTYTKAQVDTALATKADKATTYTKTETDTLLGAKADKATTYTKTEIDTVMATKADTATTLAGYGITDAYTKTEADTLLGAKANDNAVVHLAGAETIPGAKTFTSPICISGGHDTSYLLIKNSRFNGNGYIANQSEAFLDLRNTDDPLKPILGLGLRQYANPFARVIQTTFWNNTGSGYNQYNLIDSAGQLYSTTPDSSTNPGKVATVGYIDGYLPMVRTANAQTIGGVKTFTSPLEGVIKWQTVGEVNATPTYWAKICTITIPNRTTVGGGRCISLEALFGREANHCARSKIHVWGTGLAVEGAYRGTKPEFKMTVDNNDDTLVTIWARFQFGYTTIVAREIIDRNYGLQLDPNARVTMNTNTSMTADISGYNTSYDPVDLGLDQDNVVLRTGDQTIAGAKTFTGQMLATGQRAYSAGNTTDVATIGTLDAYSPMVRTSNAQTIGGLKTFTEIMKGSTFLMANKQIGGVTRVFAKASGYGIYRYGGAYLQVMCRDHLFLIKLQSGSTATLHNATVIDMDTMQPVADKTTLPFTLGYYTENDEIFVTARGLSGNKLATISWLGGSQGGSVSLALYPIEDAVVDPTAKGVIEFWTV